MFDRKQYIGWLDQQQQMYNPHLREPKTEDVDDKNEPLDLQEGLKGLAIGMGALGAGAGLISNLTKKRNPQSGKLVNPEDKKSIIGSALKGAAIGTAAVGASKYLKSAIPKYSDRAPRHAERAAGRHLRRKAEREAELEARRAAGMPHGPVRPWPAPHVDPDKISQLGRTPEFVKKGKQLAGLGLGRVAGRKISALQKPLTSKGAQTVGDLVRTFKNK